MHNAHNQRETDTEREVDLSEAMHQENEEKDNFGGKNG